MTVFYLEILKVFSWFFLNRANAYIFPQVRSIWKFWKSIYIFGKEYFELMWTFMNINTTSTSLISPALSFQLLWLSPLPVQYWNVFIETSGVEGITYANMLDTNNIWFSWDFKNWAYWRWWRDNFWTEKTEKVENFFITSLLCRNY